MSARRYDRSDFRITQNYPSVTLTRTYLLALLFSFCFYFALTRYFPFDISLEHFRLTSLNCNIHFDCDSTFEFVIHCEFDFDFAFDFDFEFDFVFAFSFCI